MKLKFKKYVCLLLSSVLFFLNGQVFAQDMGSDIISQYEIDELTQMADKVRIKFKFSERHITSDASYIHYIEKDGVIRAPYTSEKIISGSLDKYYRDLQAFQTQLLEFHTKMLATYQKYLDALPEGTYLKKATTKYINGRMEKLFGEQNYVLDKLLSIADVMQEQEIMDMSVLLKNNYYLNEERRAQHLLEIYKRDSRLRNLFLEDLAERQTYYNKLYTWDLEKLLDQLKIARASFSRETVEFFSKPNHTAEELLEYFLKHSPEEQKSLLFALRTTDRGVTTTQLIPYLRYYLKHTNRRLWKLEQYSAENLTRNISRMTFERKVEYIDDLLDFAPQTKALRQEIRQVEQVAGRKLVNRSSLHLGGIFILIGSAIVATTITTVMANQMYQSNIPQMAEIKNKLDEGEILSLDEMVDYFANERTQAEMAQNPNLLAEAFEAARTVNVLLDNSGLDLSVSENELQGDAGEIENQIPESIRTGVDNFNYERVTANAGNII